MDNVSAAFYGQSFRLAFMEKKGMKFQDWVAELGSHALGSDFEVVRPYGKQGDWKCDGRQMSTGTIFQCYGPETPTDQKTIKKIKDDFSGALNKWPNFIKRWVFVHNTPSGQPPAVLSALDTLRRQHINISFEIWAKAELYTWHNMLSADKMSLIYGPAPNQKIADNLQLEDLKPIIDALECRDPDPDAPSPYPPSVEKLAKNELSEDAAELLKLGRRKVRLVETYFNKAGTVELGEKIAQSFRARYAELKATECPADQIFCYLQAFAGYTGASPKRQVAVMAVMAYFFDKCDIFED